MDGSMANGNGRERRRHPRSATIFSAELTAGERRHAARVLNLSLGGALLDFGDASTRPSIAVGARVAVVIRSRLLEETFAAEGRAVLWNTASGPAPLLAIQFDEVVGEAAEALEELLALASVELARFRAPPEPLDVG
jgi:hypothetical protein